MDESSCNTNLTLGPGSGARRQLVGEPKAPPVHFHVLFPTWTAEETPEMEERKEDVWAKLKKKKKEEEDANSGAIKKKLRLSKEQSALLENTFRERSTLNSVQKQELADSLNLRPRQVEVWFQNRRARTKLKQTEMDCEILKRYCENLSDENRRLKKEIQELKAMKHSRSAICLFCQRIQTGEDGHISPRVYGCATKESSITC